MKLRLKWKIQFLLSRWKNEYYSKGSLKESYSYSNNGNILSKSVTELWENPYALPKREENWTYEESSGDGEYVYVKNEYEYDNQSAGRLSEGNCTKVVQYYGDGEKVTGCISYIDPDKDKYIVGFPEEILVLDRNDNTIRRRQGTYNHNGDLTELKQYFSDYALMYYIYLLYFDCI